MEQTDAYKLHIGETVISTQLDGYMTINDPADLLMVQRSADKFEFIRLSESDLSRLNVFSKGRLTSDMFKDSYSTLLHSSAVKGTKTLLVLKRLYESPFGYSVYIYEMGQVLSPYVYLTQLNYLHELQRLYSSIFKKQLLINKTKTEV